MCALARGLRVIAVSVSALMLSAVASAYVITAVPIPQSPSGLPYTNVGNPIGTLTNGTVDPLWTALEYREQTSGGRTINAAFDSWCIEPLVQDSAGPWVYNVTDLDGSGRFSNAVEDALGRLWSVADASAGSAPTLSTTPGSASLPNTTLYATAFQIALWELVSTWLSATFATDTAGNFLAAHSRLEYLDTAANAGGKGQDRIRLFVPGQDGDDPIPVPGVAWLLGLGLAAIGLRKRL
jgi:hypothetical protein